MADTQLFKVSASGGLSLLLSEKEQLWSGEMVQTRVEALTKPLLL